MFLRCATICTLLAILALPSLPALADDGPYAANWDSLKKHPDPTWFDQAKFGVYFHWSAFSVPAFSNEWYSRNMYVKGSKENKHHLATYGPLDKFGYKDFIPRFTAEKFNPDAWAELFEQAGARFAGPVAEHADGFALWPTKYSHFNAAEMGPKRDLVGELEKAIRKRGLKFITTFHHQWLWGWYPTSDKSTDAGDGRYAGLYGPAAPPTAFNYQNPQPPPTPEFCAAWEGKVREVVEKYQPDLIWFDSRLSIIPESSRQRMCAHYYNQAAKAGRDVVITCKNLEMPHGAAIEDLERGRMDRTTPFKWLNDDSIDWNSWCNVEPAAIKSPDTLVDELVDIVSKNGNLLLNITPRADGTIPEPVADALREMGKWLKVNGEAIYATGPFKVFGEGPTQIKAGHFTEDPNKKLTAQDVRFTVKGDVLYAILLDWPGEKAVVRTLGRSACPAGGEIESVSLLGGADKLEFTRDQDALTVKLPKDKPCEHAFALKITGLKDVAWDAHVRPGPDGVLRLDAPAAQLHAKRAKIHNEKGVQMIACWDEPSDWASWTARFAQAGTYEVSAVVTALNGPVQFVVEAAGQQVTGQAPKTPTWYDFQTVRLGQIKINKPGPCEIKIRPKDQASWRAMNLVRLVAKPVAGTQ